MGVHEICFKWLSFFIFIFDHIHSSFRKRYVSGNVIVFHFTRRNSLWTLSIEPPMLKKRIGRGWGGGRWGLERSAKYHIKSMVSGDRSRTSGRWGAESCDEFIVLTYCQELRRSRVQRKGGEREWGRGWDVYRILDRDDGFRWTFLKRGHCVHSSAPRRPRGTFGHHIPRL